jgi:hypothetical protein
MVRVVSSSSRSSHANWTAPVPLPLSVPVRCELADPDVGKPADRHSGGLDRQAVLRGGDRRGQIIAWLDGEGPALWRHRDPGRRAKACTTYPKISG